MLLSIVLNTGYCIDHLHVDENYVMWVERVAVRGGGGHHKYKKIGLLAGLFCLSTAQDGYSMALSVLENDYFCPGIVLEKSWNCFARFLWEPCKFDGE